MPQFCRVERDGRLLIVTINRPEVRNALHAGASEEMTKVFDEFEDDPELWVAILTGAGEKAFCAGNDLKVTAAGGPLSIGEKGFGGLTSRMGCNKPILAAVNGVAMGGGFELALACDLIIAASNATFGLPEPRVGLAALASGLQRLPRQIPLKQAMGIILTGRHVSAEEALRLGIVNEVVPPAELMSAARRWAGMILECSPLSVRASKEVALRSLDIASLEESMNARYEGIRTLLKSDDVKEGPRAFVEKRKPEWKGR